MQLYNIYIYIYYSIFLDPVIHDMPMRLSARAQPARERRRRWKIWPRFSGLTWNFAWETPKHPRHFKGNSWGKITGWWFGTFTIFHNTWDDPSHWLSYFSRWLKPPSRWLFGANYLPEDYDIVPLDVGIQSYRVILKSPIPGDVYRFGRAV